MTNETVLGRFTGSSAEWPTVLAAKLSQRLEQIGGSRGTYALSQSRKWPACDACGRSVDADLWDGSTLHEAEPVRGVTVRAWLCCQCSNAAGPLVQAASAEGLDEAAWKGSGGGER